MRPITPGQPPTKGAVEPDFGDGSTGTGITARHVYATPGAHFPALTVTDDKGGTDIAVSLQPVLVAAVDGAPTAALAADTEGGTAPLLVTLDASGSTDTDGSISTYAWDFDADGTADAVTTTPEMTHDFTAAGSHQPELVVTDDDGKTAWATLADPLDVTAPPEIAPDAVDPTVPTNVAAAGDFLYSGADAVQTGVDVDELDPERGGIVRGRTMTRDGNPLSGVSVAVLDHGEYGETITRDDGWFDMALNGGSSVTLIYTKHGYLPVHRHVDVKWGDYAVADDVVLLPHDPEVTAVELEDGTSVARGSEVGDADGTRRASIVFPQGTEATMVMPDGSTEPLDTLHVRATEYTVGETGPAAMPAPLPPTTAYTYAVELSVDEADDAGAETVSFSDPVPVYVDNFLDFPVGELVPVGYYDHDQAAWLPEDNGLIIGVLGDLDGDGLTEIDSDGTATPASADTLDTLGIDDSEREQLGNLYSPGASIWRVPVDHFSTYDFNWGLPSDNETPPAPGGFGDGGDGGGDGFGGGGADGSDPQDRTDSGDCQEGSIIECENQTLGEVIPLTGTPFTLNYRSDRTPLYGRSTQITLTGGTPPASLHRIDLEIEIAGRLHTQSFDPAPDLTYTFAWDGLDAYGRELQGSQTATIRLGYVYLEDYSSAVNVHATFGSYAASDDTLSFDTAIDNGRGVATIWREWSAQLGAWSTPTEELGGWSLDAHHVYDPETQTLYLGDGTRRSGTSVDGAQGATVVEAAVGSGDYDHGTGGVGDDATEIDLLYPREVAVAPDGGVLVADTGNNRLLRVAGDGAIDVVITSFGPDDFDIGQDGAVYAYSGGVQRYDLDAGTHACVAACDGDPDGIDIDLISNIAVGPDGSFFLSDARKHQVFRIAPNGTAEVVAGSGTRGFSGDGGPARDAQLNSPAHLDVTADGSVYIVDRSNNRVRRVDPDGEIETVAGDGTEGFSGDGGPATAAQIKGAYDVEVAADGSIFIADSHNGRIRRVRPDGVITTVIGSDDSDCQWNSPNVDCDDGTPAPDADLGLVPEIALGPDGSILMSVGYYRVVRARPVFPSFTAGDLAIASADGTDLYQFDETGRHEATLDTLTGQTLFTFTYDDAGLLADVGDAFGNVTHVERDANGRPTAIVGPYGQSTRLTTDPTTGYLTSATNPADESTVLGYHAGSDGLLETFTEPTGSTHTFEYSDSGLLTRDTRPGGGYKRLSREDIDGGRRVTIHTAVDDGVELTDVFEITVDTEGNLIRTHTDPAGRITTTYVADNGDLTVTEPDGTTAQIELTPDPRFGMQAPYAATVELQTPGHPNQTVEIERSVELADDTNLLSVSSATQSHETTPGGTWTTVYTATEDGGTITATSPEGRVQTAEYNAQGQPLRIEPPDTAGVNRAPIEYDYDDHGRTDDVQQGERRTVFDYYEAGESPNDLWKGTLQSIIDPGGRTALLVTGYDDALRPMTVRFPEGSERQLSFDANGSLETLTMESEDVHTYRSTSDGDLGEYGAPPLGEDLFVTTYDHYLDGTLRQVTHPDGSEEHDVLDPATGLLACTDFDSGAAGEDCAGTATVFDHFEDPALVGVPYSITDADTSLTYGYTGPLATSTTWSGRTEGTVAYTYNDKLLVDSETVSVQGEDETLEVTYDDDDLPEQIGELDLDLDPSSGLLTGATLGTLTTSYTYDAYGQFSSFTVSDPEGNVVYEADYGADTGERDILGRIATKTETVGAHSTTEQYGYDDAGRLETSATTQDGTTESSTYAYDANGNRHCAGEDGAPLTATFNAQDQLTTCGNLELHYDRNGRLIERLDTTTDEVTTYAYNQYGDLTRIGLPDGTGVEYTTDPAGNLVQRTLTHPDGTTEVEGYLYSDGPQPVARLDASGTLQARYVYATRGHVPDYIETATSTYQIATDQTGSPRAVIDSDTGEIVQEMHHDAWGRVTADTNPGFQPFGFAGGFHDRATGLVRFGARWYDPELGRWISKDPIGQSGGLNVYQYAGGDPVNFIDPSGLISWAELQAYADAFVNGTRSPSPNSPYKDWTGLNPAAKGGDEFYGRGGRTAPQRWIEKDDYHYYSDDHYGSKCKRVSSNKLRGIGKTLPALGVVSMLLEVLVSYKEYQDELEYQQSPEYWRDYMWSGRCT